MIFGHDKTFEITLLKIRKDWSHPDIWSSSETSGPRLMLISWRMMKWGPLSSSQKQMIQGLLCVGQTFFFSQLKRKRETCIPYCAFCSLELNTESTLLFQINSLKTENFCLGLCGGKVTASSTTKSRQTAKALCKKEYVEIFFLFFSFLHFVQQLVLSTLYFSSLRINLLSQRNPEGQPSEPFQSLNVLIPSAEKKNERKFQLFIWRLCLTHQLLDDNLESFKFSWQFWPLITEMIHAFLRLPTTFSVQALVTTLLIIFK